MKAEKPAVFATCQPLANSGGRTILTFVIPTEEVMGLRPTQGDENQLLSPTIN
jgi:hypothetical protein